jgi:hypothetical protein
VSSFCYFIPVADIKRKESKFGIYKNHTIMIQRIQTIWLVFASLVSGQLLIEHLLNFKDKSGIKYFIEFSGINRISESGHELVEKTLLISFLLILIPLLSMITIFLFKIRKLQFRVTVAAIILSAGLILNEIYYACIGLKQYDAELIPGIIMFFPLIVLIFLIFACIGITKDEKLVKSYDRLR